MSVGDKADAIEWLETEATYEDFRSADGPIFQFKDDLDIDWQTAFGNQNVGWEEEDSSRWPMPWPWDDLNNMDANEVDQR